MALKKYGVLKGKAIASRMGSGSSPHYQIHIVDDQDDYRIAINVKSQLSPSELLYLLDDDFTHPVTEIAGGWDPGFTELQRGPGSGAWDYIRGNLFDRSAMRALPHNVPGPDNDLNEKIDAYVQRAIADEGAMIYAFGERWGPENKKDKYFGFRPGNGIHDIHMNQGNVGRFVKDDGVWQDGGLLIHFPAVGEPGEPPVCPEQWVALFLAFQSQAWHTDDQTGHRIEPVPEPTPGPEPSPGERDGHVRIVAALVNPPGDDVGHETVTLLNTTPDPIDMKGWMIADKNKRKSALSGPILAAGAVTVVELTGEGAQLGNKGGIITLLDPQGLKIDGVSYTRQQARRQGWTLVF